MYSISIMTEVKIQIKLCHPPDNELTDTNSEEISLWKIQLAPSEWNFVRRCVSQDFHCKASRPFPPWYRPSLKLKYAFVWLSLKKGNHTEAIGVVRITIYVMHFIIWRVNTRVQLVTIVVPRGDNYMTTFVKKQIHASFLFIATGIDHNWYLHHYNCC